LRPPFQLKDLEAIFQHKLLKLLLSKGKITEDLVGMLMSWRHSGFNVFCEPRIYPRDGEAMENLARYIISAFLSRLLLIGRRGFFQERMNYIQAVRDVSKVYQWGGAGMESGEGTDGRAGGQASASLASVSKNRSLTYGLMEGNSRPYCLDIG
jgi:hypothetical protein